MITCSLREWEDCTENSSFLDSKEETEGSRGIPRIRVHVLPSVKRKGALISPKMSSEKKGVNAAEQTLEFVQDLVVRPLLNHFSTWECKPVERIVSTQNASLCYS